MSSESTKAFREDEAGGHVRGFFGRRSSSKPKGTVREYVEAIGLALLAALIIRHFVIEAFKIPSGSMIPTLAIGDHIFVNKFRYGIRLPFTKTWVAKFADLKRGEVVVFMYPIDEKKNFIKRVVGLPGDTIALRQNRLFINGQEAKREKITDKELLEGLKSGGSADFFWETIQGSRHVVRYQYASHLKTNFGPATIPEGHFFAMGDNRDNSSDSRQWGFVPMNHLKGRAIFVWLSVAFEDGPLPVFRWDRIGEIIK